MKKVLISLLAVLLTLAMVLSLAACGEDSKKKSKKSDDEDEEKEGTSDVGENEEEGEDEGDEDQAKTPAELIVGTWEGVADLGKQSAASYQALGMDISLPSARVTMTLTFEADGSYYVSYDEDEMNAAARTCGEGMIAAMADYYGMSEDAFLSESGYDSRDAFMDDFMEGFTATLAALGDKTGSYKIKNGDLYREIGDVDAVAEPFTVTETKLTIKFPEAALETVEEELREQTRKVLEAQYPITLTRVK